MNFDNSKILLEYGLKVNEAERQGIKAHALYSILDDGDKVIVAAYLLGEEGVETVPPLIDGLFAHLITNMTLFDFSALAFQRAFFPIVRTMEVYETGKPKDIRHYLVFTHNDKRWAIFCLLGDVEIAH